MLNSDACNDFAECKQMINLDWNLSVKLRWLKPFDCVETIAILVNKQMSFNSFKN